MDAAVEQLAHGYDGHVATPSGGSSPVPAGTAVTTCCFGYVAFHRSVVPLVSAAVSGPLSPPGFRTVGCRFHPWEAAKRRHQKVETQYAKSVPVVSCL
ncbi:hypothetical protein FM101_02010 [Arthrobacter rhombi]|uniref:Uncharacterized protein n=1 Tax=Arthrobacter rhombi TaxID=71253 RepID=A0A1R4F334_9MICC|nr:hypothetical protein FM101_02010 [Arthrobacter rhombi]